MHQNLFFKLKIYKCRFFITILINIIICKIFSIAIQKFIDLCPLALESIKGRELAAVTHAFTQEIVIVIAVRNGMFHFYPSSANLRLTLSVVIIEEEGVLMMIADDHKHTYVKIYYIILVYGGYFLI